MRTMNVLVERQIDLFAGIFFSLINSLLLLLMNNNSTSLLFSSSKHVMAYGWYRYRIEYSHHHLIDTDELINWTPAQKINVRRKKTINLHYFSVKARARNPIWLINKLYLVSTASLVDFFGGKFFVVFLYASIDYEILRDSFYFSDFTERYHPTLFPRHNFPWLVSFNNEFCWFGRY